MVNEELEEAKLVLLKAKAQKRKVRRATPTDTEFMREFLSVKQDEEDNNDDDKVSIVRQESIKRTKYYRVGKLFESGMNLTDIRKQTGYTPNRIIAMLRNYKKVVNEDIEIPDVTTKYQNNSYNDVIELVKLGFRPLAIMKELSITHATVSKHRKSALCNGDISVEQYNLTKQRAKNETTL